MMWTLANYRLVSGGSNSLHTFQTHSFICSASLAWSSIVLVRSSSLTVLIAL